MTYIDLFVPSSSRTRNTQANILKWVISKLFLYDCGFTYFAENDEKTRPSLKYPIFFLPFLLALLLFVGILHQYKAPAILKKTLETHHPTIRLYTLKISSSFAFGASPFDTIYIFKSLIPYLPRKWRAMNMKIISDIYAHVRLDTRDDWLSGEPDTASKVRSRG